MMVSVTRVLVDKAGLPLHFEKPKSKTSRRAVLLPDFVVQALGEHRKQQAAERLAAGPQWSNGQLIFCNGIGEPLHQDHVRQHFRKVAKAANLPHGGVTVLADGRRVLSWSSDGTLQLWDLDRGELLYTVASQLGRVVGATVLADGRRALSWCSDRSLRLFDTKNGRLLGIYFADARMVAPTIQAERGRVFTGDALGHIHILRLDVDSRPTPHEV
jgi:hypothetical protein